MLLSKSLILGFVVLFGSAAAVADCVKNEEAVLLLTVQGFYSWVLQHGEEARRLEPHVVKVNGSNQHKVDLSSLAKYSDALMASGFFAPEFAAHVSDYYRRNAEAVEKIPVGDFDEMARDGRGPLMDAEDIDVFFCSQEADYSPAYVAGTRLQGTKCNGETASSEVVTPDRWKTEFGFRKIGNKWLISRYCLYR